MEPDKFQQAWQKHSSQTRVTVDTDLLLKVVQRSHAEFQAMIFLRDCREVGVSLSMIPLWFYLGWMLSLPWTWYLTVPALVWVIGFFLVDRLLHRQKCIGPDDTLLESVTESLNQVEHQIWLLRNVFWWYLLPFTISILAFFAHVGFRTAGPPGGWSGILAAACFFAFGCVFLFAVYGFVYYLNQLAVRTQLEPRRQELLALVTGLRDETTSEVSGEYPLLMSDKSFNCSCSPRRLFVAGLWFVVLLSIGLGGIYLASSFGPTFQEKSPFAAVRWQDSQPEVKVGDEWFKLVSLDELPASEIVAFSKRTHGNQWRKRFEEDLVAILTGMGHEPKHTVRLVVMPLGSEETRSLENVPMTWANRRAIWEAAQARERSEQEQPTRGPVQLDDADAPLTKLIIDLRQEKNLVGLAAMVMVDGHVVASAVDGERKKGSGVWLEIGDRWHLGGVTKSITATMIARLVESGQLKWSTSIGECFPEASIHEDWKPVTLQQLLTDTAGAPVNFPREVWGKRPPLGPECTQARREAVLNVIATQPASPPGKKYAYSSVSYTIAGAMAEKATGATWEELVKREVFEPLQFTGAGFGPPKSPDETLEQPRGHRASRSGKVPANDDEDNTPIIGPAATVHLTLGDLCAYATEHLRGDSGEGKLLSAETYKRLHSPELSHYACGWIRKEPGEELPYTVYWHNGTNTRWYALVVFIPEKKLVVAVTSNDGDIANAEAAAWEIVKASVTQINVGVVPPSLERQPQPTLP